MRMQEIAARDTPGAGSDQLQVIETPIPARDQRSITAEVGDRVMEISLTEMEFYCDLFEEMFVELDRREAVRIIVLEGFLDEFDRAEIERLKLRYGTLGPL
jgi:hypothetical protein